jgi:D-psicose/D-tagatose/L-ribulose 3-epimerase
VQGHDREVSREMQPQLDANPLGIHALVWTGSWDRDAVVEACERTRQTGYDLLEVPLLDPGTVDPDMTADALAAAGLDATCSLGLSFDADISSTDHDVVERGHQLLLQALEVAAALGSSYLGGVLYSALGKYRTPPTERGRSNVVAVLREVASAAAERDIRLGLEPVNRYESNLVNTVEQGLDLIEDIGAEQVVIHFDAYHAHIEEEDLATPIRRAAAAGRLGYVHVGESHRGALGTGQVDLPGLFRALAEVDYRGPIVFESFSSAVVSERFVGALAIWRDLWVDNLALAQQANTYLRSALEEARS